MYDFLSDYWKQSTWGKSWWRRCELVPIGNFCHYNLTSVFLYPVYGSSSPVYLIWILWYSDTEIWCSALYIIQFPLQHLIDLAGSESSKTETTGLRRKEGSYINKSLLTLGTVRFYYFDDDILRLLPVKMILFVLHSCILFWSCLCCQQWNLVQSFLQRLKSFIRTSSYLMIMMLILFGCVFRFVKRFVFDTYSKLYRPNNLY